jgi:hypothetical protein
VVEHLYRDPNERPITEADAAQAVPLRGGLCLVCGEWVEAGGEDVYAVSVTAAGGDAAEYVVHATCLATVAHPGMRLPLRTSAMPEQAPENYLDAKRQTYEGR